MNKTLTDDILLQKGWECDDHGPVEIVTINLIKRASY
ncbi:hypothetical protein QFZ73_005686 [Peribacillus sp. V2I11]|nr:hypothetical protein [Peribacillus sp. V2I11]